MAYLGELEEQDFHQLALERGSLARDVFLEAVVLCYRDYWNENDQKFGFCLQSFQCTSCDNLFGVPDFD
ncbi:hypothetical protein [Pseudobacteriovorax antillogorgiicola]|uniref:hypothetical protein n=1 Tax=Pseudobacteriovorax antillogorgiicola TaxID=1513793 RepID=UPI00104946AF|nr:hypothetical protein [Pseudobacteriovorax antillogorgiicola]